ncbi:hypothetical protein [Candidatus Igneacidithiobacillus taiwanensis]|uniref:hypothetical protein n=1 Tax=Candidatus Igneacidithiobacillus taiwanensis TaxID=1945924 RepID=UPI00289ADCA0|nr:hypothetical protein [Candidatus Igneacidithiobacillus taiwanensis]
MTTLYQEQQALLHLQLTVLRWLRDGLRHSAERLHWPITASDLDDPEAAERLAALNDRFTKLQDQLAGAMRHAHTMLGERYRSYFDVVTWMTHEGIITAPEVWLELRTLRNQLTHDYDWEAQTAAQYLNAVHDNMGTLMAIFKRFEEVCNKYGLLPAVEGSE